MAQRMRRRMLVAGTLAAAGLISARDAQATQVGKVTIALVLKSLADPFTVAMANSAQNYQKHYSSQLDLTVRGTTTEADTSAQMRILDELIDARMSAIVIAPTDSKALIPVATRAINAGIIVIAIDNPFDDAAGIPVPFVGPDNRKGARIVGDYLATKLKPGDEVGIIEGISADRNAQQRTAGYKDAMSAAGARIVAIQSGAWEYRNGNEAASRILNAYPRLRALLCGNDNMAMGAVDAVRGARRTGGVYITGYNDIDAIKPLLRKGLVVATMNQFADRQAVFGVDFALKAITENRKQRELSRFIETPLQLVTKDDR
ncbi:substrate-binding domain-containing protein [Paraburkholderia sp. GAS42]|jgi:ribose transport system substrate-binding protein|uniref:substrate-binding domain-containing protein n=1 Tax=Paraburkholderia sp. GAS42 TaxID=3035135 RepID=UPI003D1957E8